MRRDADGFTLLEIILVIALIGTLVSVLMPRLGGGFSLAIRNTAKELEAELKYVSQRAIGTGFYRNPFIGNCGIPAAYRIDRDKLAAVTLELGERDFHRIRVMIFRRAQHDKQT